ncbi:hypothetical protein, partial [Burkholderia vietnamiensis]|uniref:hypothetical protein n=1 Tax=Burkholderia vietnamiensis TaxID=60552 RepID=UPI001ABA35A8
MSATQGDSSRPAAWLFPMPVKAWPRETLINRPTRELVGGADPQIPDAEVKRSEFGEVCPGKAPHFL